MLLNIGAALAQHFSHLQHMLKTRCGYALSDCCIKI